VLPLVYVSTLFGARFWLSIGREGEGAPSGPEESFRSGYGERNSAGRRSGGRSHDTRVLIFVRARSSAHARHAVVMPFLNMRASCGLCVSSLVCGRTDRASELSTEECSFDRKSFFFSFFVVFVLVMYLLELGVPFGSGSSSSHLINGSCRCLSES
jgi:hypothetical protein